MDRNLQRDLGPVRSHHSRSRKALVRMAVSTMLLMLVGLGLGIALWLDPPRSQDNMVALGVLSVVLLLLALVPVLVAHRKRSLCVTLHARGFSFMQNDRFRAFPWADIRALWWQGVSVSIRGVRVGMFLTVTVESRSGDRVKLDHWVDQIEQVGEHVAHEATRHMSPIVRERLAKQERVSFGRKLAVDATTLWLGRRRLPRADVARVLVANGFIVLLRRGQKRPWARVRLASVPNPFVFVELLTQHSSTRAATSYERPLSNPHRERVRLGDGRERESSESTRYGKKPPS